jgi:rhodanese-related sulfurtransferase
MRIAEAHIMAEGYAQVRPGDVARHDDLTYLDVRADTNDLLGDLGHINGVRHVPLARVVAAGLDGVPKDSPVVVVCNDGRESRDAAIALVAVHGFSEVYHLVGGMRRWSAEDRPVARTPTFEPLE